MCWHFGRGSTIEATGGAQSCQTQEIFHVTSKFSYSPVITLVFLHTNGGALTLHQVVEVVSGLETRATGDLEKR